ncbi:MAG: nucleotidyltransferase domain-containing protein [Patescibacteria group bacterium]
MAQKRNAKVNKIKKYINEYVDILKGDGLVISKIYFYGSQVKGIARKDSDIDICIVSPEFKNRWDAFDYLWQKRRRQDVLRGIEPVGYNPKDFVDEDPFVYEIKKTGQEIKVN